MKEDFRFQRVAAITRWLQLGLLVVGFMVSSQQASAYSIPKGKPIAQSPDTEFLRRVSRGVSDLAEGASKALVFVSVSKAGNSQPYGEIDPFEFFFGPEFRENRPEFKQKGLGSGFFIDLQKGYIITNNHVIQGADDISLKLANGKVYDGKVLGRDDNTDIAVVQVVQQNFSRKGLAALAFGNSDLLKTGEFVVAVGAPFGLESSVSFGILSARGRGNLNITALGDFLQTDAAINPGNSGGPLLDASGMVVGMNTAIYSRSGSSAGIGFAVPSNLVRRIAHQLINRGRIARGYLGVSLQPLDEGLAHGLGVAKDTEGVLVAKVQKGTPADRGHLEDGDVIVALNGEPTNSPSDLTNRIGLLPPKSKVQLTVLRGGTKMNLTVVLGEYPRNDSVLAAGENKEADALGGLGLVAVSHTSGDGKMLLSRYGLASTEGVLVTSVKAGSRAHKAGLREGDLLIKANRKRLNSVKDFLAVYKKSAKILIHLERQGDFLFASLRKN